MRFWLAFFAFALGALPVRAGSQAEAIEVVDPFVRRVPPVSKITAAYMTLKNHAAQEAVIVAARTPLAKTIELHVTVNEGGLLRMRPLSRFVVPPQGMLVAEPAGYHFMLIDLVKPLAIGERIPLVLEFADGSRKTIEADAR